MLTYTIPPKTELAARLQAAAVQLHIEPAALATGMLYSCLSGHDTCPLALPDASPHESAPAPAPQPPKRKEESRES